ncbi:MAG: hypothetical protein ABIO70_02095 [Pseudomonadota bacterium]
MRRTLRAALLSLIPALALAGAHEADASPGLHGKRLRQPVPPPEFAVQNQAGDPRTAADLVGKPHVIWFYLMSGTPG